MPILDLTDDEYRLLMAMVTLGGSVLTRSDHSNRAVHLACTCSDDTHKSLSDKLICNISLVGVETRGSA